MNDATPDGVYKLKDKEKDAVLKGKGYASPVTFWMPFNAGIGIHDASWRNAFGDFNNKRGSQHILRLSSKLCDIVDNLYILNKGNNCPHK